MPVPAVTCGAKIVITWNEGAGFYNAYFSATATNTPTSWLWTILSVPAGLEALLTGSWGDFANGVATMQGPSLTGIPTNVASGTIVVQCVATNGDGPSNPLIDRWNGQQPVVIKTELLDLPLPGNKEYNWGGAQLDEVLRKLETNTAALHKATAAEISAVTPKTTPIAADLLLIEDSESANAKKSVQIGNLPTATTGAKGLLPILGGGTTNFLRADGSWNVPPGGGGGADRGERGYGAVGPVVTPGLVPTVTCGEKIGYAWNSGTQEAELTATATGSPISWAWDIIGMPDGLTYLVTPAGLDILTASVDVAFWAASLPDWGNTVYVDTYYLSFAATLVPGDKIIISGSVSNDGVYTVETVSDQSFQVVEALADEVKGASVTLSMHSFGDFVLGHSTLQNPKLRIPSTNTDYGAVVVRCVATNAVGPSDPTVDMQHGQQIVAVYDSLLDVTLPSDGQYSHGQTRDDGVGLDLALRGIITQLGLPPASVPPKWNTVIEPREMPYLAVFGDHIYVVSSSFDDGKVAIVLPTIVDESDYGRMVAVSLSRQLGEVPDYSGQYCRVYGLWLGAGKVIDNNLEYVSLSSGSVIFVVTAEGKWARLSEFIPYDRIKFFLPGVVATGAEQGGVWTPRRSGEIVRARMYRKSGAGASGSTIVDVNIRRRTIDAWTSIFTTQANRPSIAYNENTKGGESGAPNTDMGNFRYSMGPAYDEAWQVGIDVDAVHTGGAAVSDLTVELIVRWDAIREPS